MNITPTSDGLAFVIDEQPWSPGPYPDPSECGIYVRLTGGALVQWPDGTLGPVLLPVTEVPPADPAEWPAWAAEKFPGRADPPADPDPQTGPVCPPPPPPPVCPAG